MTTGWTVPDRIPVWTIFSAPVQIDSGAHPASCKICTEFSRGKMRPQRASDHSTPCSAAVMEQYSYNSTQPLGHTGPAMELLYVYFFDAKLLDEFCVLQ